MNNHHRRFLSADAISPYRSSWFFASCAAAGSTLIVQPARSFTSITTRSDGQLRMTAREKAQEEFMRGDLRVMVATKAFGLGIDKRDVRFVIHWTFPDSLETYYQEAGRAGRDGAPATAYLLYRLEDRRIQTYFLGTRYPKPEECQRLCATLATGSVSDRSEWTVDALATAANIPERHLCVILSHLESEDVARIHCDEIDFAEQSPRTIAREVAAVIAKYTKRRTRDRERLQSMMHYAQSPQCRTAQRLHYFGEQDAAQCAGCDVCERGAS